MISAARLTRSWFCSRCSFVSLGMMYSPWRIDFAVAMYVVLKKGAAGALVSGPEKFLCDCFILSRHFRSWSTRERDFGNGDVQFIRLYSIDNVADVAVFNYRGISVLHVVLGQVVLHPLLSPTGVGIEQIDGAVIDDSEIHFSARHHSPLDNHRTRHT